MAKTTTTETAVATEKAPRAKKDGLRKPQVRALAALAKLKEGQTLGRAGLSDAAKIDPAWVSATVGSADAESRAACEARNGYKCLITLGFAKSKVIDVEGKKEAAYSITPAGRKALEKALKAQAAAAKD